MAVMEPWPQHTWQQNMVLYRCSSKKNTASAWWVLLGTESRAAGKGLLCAFIHSLIQQTAQISQTGIHLWSVNRDRKQSKIKCDKPPQSCPASCFIRTTGNHFIKAQNRTQPARHNCAFTTESRIAMQRQPLFLFQLWTHTAIRAL